MSKIEMKPVKGFTGYFVTKSGEVYSTRRNGEPVKMTPNVFNGYERIKLTRNDGSISNTTVHRLVAEVYLKKPKGKNIVNHIDGVKNNNKVTNLEWTDHRGNMKHYGEKLEKGYRIQRNKIKQDLDKAKQSVLNLAFSLYKDQAPEEFIKLYGVTYNLSK
jgi:hypothetical protein